MTGPDPPIHVLDHIGTRLTFTVDGPTVIDLPSESHAASGGRTHAPSRGGDRGGSQAVVDRAIAA
jgi:hypothetical protein